MRRKLKTVLILGACMILCMGVTGCMKENKAPIQTENDNETGDTKQAVKYSDRGQNTELERDSETETYCETEKSGEGTFYDGANLSGRVVEFSEQGFTITPRTIIVNEDGSMEGGVAAPGYESEEDNIAVTYKEDTTFQIVYFSMAAQAESSRENTDKSSIKKETDVEVFGTCQGEKQWIADKVVITRWQ